MKVWYLCYSSEGAPDKFALYPEDKPPSSQQVYEFMLKIFPDKSTKYPGLFAKKRAEAISNNTWNSDWCYEAGSLILIPVDGSMVE